MATRIQKTSTMKIFIYTFFMLISLTGWTQIRFDDGDGPVPIEDPVRPPSVSVSISGPTSANINDYDYYYVTVRGGSHSSTSYSVSGGSIVSQSRTRVRVRWTSTGRRYVRATARVSGRSYSRTRYVTVSCPTLSPGRIGNSPALNNNPICYNESTTILNASSASGGSGISYQWQWASAVPGVASLYRNVSGGTGSSYSTGRLTSSRYYRRRATSCGQTKYTSSVKVTVEPNISVFNVQGGGTVCSGSSKQIYISSSHPTVYYQMKRNGSNYGSAKKGTGTTMIMGNYSAAGTYTIVAKKGSCSKNMNGSVVITVNPPSNAGTMSSSGSRCGSGNLSFSLSGYTGTIQRWEMRYRNGSGGWSGWSPITETDNVKSVNPHLNAWSGGNRVYEIRTRIRSGVCGYAYRSKQVTVYPNLSAGSITNAQTICHNGDPAPFASATPVSGSNGSYVYTWQYSSNGSSGWTNIGSTNSTGYNPPAGLTSSRWYRRRVTSCGLTGYSNTIKVTVNSTVNPGSINGARTICYGDNPPELGSSTNASGGGSGLKYQWEVATNGSNWSPITSGGTGNKYNPESLTSSRWYRRGASTTTCPTRYSNTVKITVNGNLAAGSINGTQTLCYDQNPGPLNNVTAASGGVSRSYVWEKSNSSNGVFIAISGTNVASYTPSKTNVTTWYRRRVTSGSACGTGVTNVIKVEVDPATVAGSISINGTTLCGPGTKTFDLSGHTGTIKYWQSRHKDGSGEYTPWATFEGADDITSVSFSFEEWTNGIRTYQIRARIQSGICSSLYPKKTITIKPQPTTFNLTGGGNYCDGESGLQIGLSGSQLNVNYQLKSGNADLALIAGTGQAIDFGTFTTEGTYTVEAIHLSGGCLELMSGSAVVGQLPLPKVFNVQGGGVYCRGEIGKLITLGNSEAGVNYQLLRDGGTTGIARSGGNGAIDFGYQKIAGEYEVVAVKATTFCEIPMNGSAIVEVKELPSSAVIVSVAYGFEGTTISRNDPPAGETWYWQSGSTGTDEMNASESILATEAGTYYLRAKKENGCWSDAAFVTLGATEPANVEATMMSNESLNVTWSEVQNAEGYKVSRSQGSNDDFTEVFLAPAVTLSYTDEGLSTGTIYHYRIQSMVGGQLSSAIQVATATTATTFNGNEAIEHTPTYNGNVSAIRWKGTNDESEQVFSYNYDGLNRLSGAQYAAKTSSSYAKNKGHFSVPSISYDLNGNIQSLTRQGKNLANNADIIDDLVYTYGVGGSNQLMKVEDDRNGAGFKDGNNSGNDYQYDKNGNMTMDLNKNIVVINYNFLNLPERVEFENGDYITYLYDAVGIKLSQQVFKAGETIPEKTTDYVGQFIYETKEDGARELQLIQHNEGRIVPVISSDGEAISDWDYQYHLKDHLGNARVTFSTTEEVYTTRATMEDQEENADFEPWVQSPGNGPSAGNSSAHVMRLNTNDSGDGTVINGVAGLRSILSVQKGDVLDLSAKAYYETIPADNGAFLGNSLFAMILTGSTGGDINTVEGGGVNASNLDESVLDGIQGVKDGKVDNSVPRAYINYILFGEDMSYKKAGFRQISGSAYNDWEQVVLDEQIIIDEPGYILVYVSNETNAASVVDFDDLTITHTKTNVVQSDDYYPFGLTFNSYSRTASTANNFKYNGFEEQKEWGVYDYLARYYDPAIGRFLMVDPASELMRRFTPYNYTYNNPVRFTDPDGMFPDEVTGGEQAGGGNGDDDPNIVEQAITDFTDWLSSVTELSSFSFDGSLFDFSSEEDVEQAEETLENAREVEVAAAVGENITEGEVSPYLKVSVGKQSAEGGSSFLGIVPGYAELTITPGGIEIGTGYDYTGAVEPGSFSISGGLQFGSSDAAVEGNIGTSIGGRNIGVEGSTSTDLKEQQIGVVISTSSGWVSVSGGGSTGVVDFKK